MADNDAMKQLGAALSFAKDMDAPVNVRLQHYASALALHLPTFGSAVDALVDRLHAAAAGQLAPQVGEIMPPFLLPDDNGSLVSLAQCLENAPTAIAFHRGYWCPFCQLNTRALAAAHEKALAVGGQIVAITPEMQPFVRQQKAAAGANFKILSDIGNGYALSINIAIWVGDALKTAMSELGRDLAVSQGNGSWFLPIPATFIVNREGIITDRYVDPDYRRRMDVDDLLNALQRAR